MFNKLSYFDNAESTRLTSALYGDVTDDLALLGAFTYFDAENFTDGNGTGLPRVLPSANWILN
jgi:hypothetical protein